MIFSTKASCRPNSNESRHLSLLAVRDSSTRFGMTSNQARRYNLQGETSSAAIATLARRRLSGRGIFSSMICYAVRQTRDASHRRIHELTIERGETNDWLF